MKKINRFLIFFCFTSIFHAQNLSINNDGNALSFDGKTDYFNIPNSILENSKSILENQLTIEAHIKPHNLEGYKPILNKYWCQSRQGSFQFGLRDGKLSFIWTEIGHCEYNASAITKSKIRKNEWSHVAVTFNNGEVNLFINGEIQKIVRQGEIQRLNSTKVPILVGAYRKMSGENAFFFDGKMNHIRLWKIAKSKREIRKNRKRLIQNQSGDLIINLKVDTFTHN